MSFRRVLLLVLDSLGIGEMPDAAKYGDVGSDTLGNLARRRPLHIPNLTKLGLVNAKPLVGIAPSRAPLASYGRCALASPGKDTTTGHWEMAGIQLERPFPVFPDGFPLEIMCEFERLSGKRALGNIAASGTEIIETFGEEHIRTGLPIVYTSADSVFQIAAHEEVVSLEELYRMCEIAREILRGPNEVGRVIARPFSGRPGAFVRDQENRHDYAIPPPEGMLLDLLEAGGIPIFAIGKIHDVFLGRGISSYEKTKDNADGMAKILKAMGTMQNGLIFANLVDFDSLYGHRNDVEGFAGALEDVDRWIPSLLDCARDDDLIIVAADHGNDPTTPSTDHSREYVPVLAYGPRAKRGINLGTRDTLSDIGETLAENFLGPAKVPAGSGEHATHLKKGTSFLDVIL